MFEIKNNKVFMDAVHGYINVPKCFINNLVDTEYFQRLRNIDQTGYAFPNGTDYHPNNVDGSVVEFCGARIPEGLNQFSIQSIVVEE